MRKIIDFFPKLVKFVAANVHYVKPILEAVEALVDKVNEIKASKEPVIAEPAKPVE